MQRDRAAALLQVVLSLVLLTHQVLANGAVNARSTVADTTLTAVNADPSEALFLGGNVVLSAALVFTNEVTVMAGATFTANADFTCNKLTVLGTAVFVNGLFINGALNVQPGSTVTTWGTTNVAGIATVAGTLNIVHSSSMSVGVLTGLSTGRLGFRLASTGTALDSTLTVVGSANLNIMAAVTIPANYPPIKVGAQIQLFTVGTGMVGTVGFAKLTYTTAPVPFSAANAGALISNCSATACSVYGAPYYGDIANYEDIRTERNLFIGLVAGITCCAVLMVGFAFWIVGFAREADPAMIEIRRREKALAMIERGELV